MSDLLVADCLEALRDLPEASFDAVVTDPPYGIGFMGHDWDQPGLGPLRSNGDPHRARGNAWGFQNQDERERFGGPDSSRDVTTRGGAMNAGRYDLSAEANRRYQEWCRAWAIECLRVLRPGGWLVSFAGTRTYHRLASGIEDAGFEIRDQWSWLFGSGFPKSLDVSKAIDKRAGAEREVVGSGRSGGGRVAMNDAPGHGRERDYLAGEFDRTAPATSDAEKWQGWGTALKPSHEPILLARKPLAEGSVAANVLAHGTGALNIDACRIATADPLGGGAENPENRRPGIRNEGWERPCHDDPGWRDAAAARVREQVAHAEALGRWPGNLVLTHHEDCWPLGEKLVRGDGHTPAARPSSTFAANAQPENDERSWRRELVEEWDCVPACPVRLLNEQSGESWSNGRSSGTPDSTGIYGDGMPRGDGRETGKGDYGGAARFFYCAKTSRAEREAGLDDFAERELRWSSGDENPGSFQSDGTERRVRNHHPTVKPLTLTRWVARLVCPPGGRVLDPFAGSGTTGIACGLEGFDFVGVERDEEYAAIARARLAFWADHGEDALRIVGEREASERRRRAVAEAGQLELGIA